MTATQTVAVPSAPGMKAREPSFTLDSDDDDGDTVCLLYTSDAADE